MVKDKKNIIVRLIGRFLRTCDRVRIYYMKRTCRLDKRVMVFISRPDYSDNGRALYEFLCKSGYGDKYMIYWIVKDPSNCMKMFPDSKAVFLKAYNWLGLPNQKALKIYMSAGTALVTHAFFLAKKDSLSGQKRIMLWHGCGYKDKVWKKFIPYNYDKACVAGPLFIKTKMKYWGLPEDRIIAKGYPRYDWMLHPSNAAKQMLDNLKGNHKKLIIWMPTFRNAYGFKEKGISSFPLMKNQQDWEDLDNFCIQLSICILVKLHMYQADYKINFETLTNVKIISNNDFDKMQVKLYEFLALTDGLISDYSSVSVDYLLVNKPIAYALDDFEMYKSMRGFVFENPLKYMPGHHLYNLNDLKIFLKDCSEGKDVYKERRSEMMDIAIYKSDNYCLDVLKALDL